MNHENIQVFHRHGRQSEPTRHQLTRPQPERVVNLVELGIAGEPMSIDLQLQQRLAIRAGGSIANRRPRGLPIQRVDPEIRQNLIETGYDEHRNRENRMKLRQQPHMEYIASENGMIILVEPFHNRNQKFSLECMHWFHFDCLQSWLKFKSQCPECKKSVGSVLRLARLEAEMREDLDQTRDYDRNNQTMIGDGRYDDLHTG